MKSILSNVVFCDIIRLIKKHEGDIMKKTIGLKSEGYKGMLVLVLFICVLLMIIISAISMPSYDGLMISSFIFGPMIAYFSYNLYQHHKLPEYLIQVDDRYLYLNYRNYTTRIELIEISYILPIFKHLYDRFSKIRVYTENGEFVMGHVDQVQEVVREIMLKVVKAREVKHEDKS